MGRGNLLKKKKKTTKQNQRKEILNGNYGSLMNFLFLHDLRFIKSQTKTYFVFHCVLQVRGKKMTVTIEPYHSQIHSNLALHASRNASRNPMIGKVNPSHFLWNYLVTFAAQSWDVHPIVYVASLCCL